MRRAWNNEFLLAEDFVILLNEADILGAGDHPMTSVARRPDDVGAVVQALHGIVDADFLHPSRADIVVVDDQFVGHMARLDRKSVVYGSGVSVRLDLGGRRIIKNKK